MKCDHQNMKKKKFNLKRLTYFFLLLLQKKQQQKLQMFNMWTFNTLFFSPSTLFQFKS